MSKWKWITLIIVTYLAAPPLISALLRPFALSCRQDNSMPIFEGFELEFFECDFGWPQPFEFLAFTFASGSYTMILLGFISIGMMAYLGWIYWHLRAHKAR